ncbi:hypothetical protein [Thermogymnomonas acidicola]|uniref:hypothetical protein n=1 Tax=Thermogymnomonas acidicola TaxID=399579 RepID=UPI0009466A63|nr:hypothetical protein [Thermogymnomonas acidicola]
MSENAYFVALPGGLQLVAQPVASEVLSQDIGASWDSLFSPPVKGRFTVEPGAGVLAVWNGNSTEFFSKYPPREVQASLVAQPRYVSNSTLVVRPSVVCPVPYHMVLSAFGENFTPINGTFEVSTSSVPRGGDTPPP